MRGGVLFAAVAAAVSMLFISGCGASDPYVGSWKQADKPGNSPDLVIARTDAGYRLAFLGTTIVDGWVPLTQLGGELVGSPNVMAPLPVNVKIVLAYDKASDRLLYSDNSQQRLSYVKVSYSTSTSSPSD